MQCKKKKLSREYLKVCSSAERQSWTANNTVFELASNVRYFIINVASLSYVIMRVLQVYQQLQGSIKREGIMFKLFGSQTPAVYDATDMKRRGELWGFSRRRISLLAKFTSDRI